VRRGASWTAAYHRQLTVAAVTRPVRSSVGALGVLAVERSWLLLAQTTSARKSRSRAVGRRRRGRPGQQASHGVGRRCPAGGVHPSGLGVRDPAVQPSGVRSPGVVVRVSGGPVVCCPPVRCPPSGVHPSSLQPAGVRPVGLDASVFSRTERWRWPRSVRRAPLTTGTSQVLVGCRAVERLGRRPSSLDAGGATELACWSAGVSVADPAGLGGAARAR
jgi:hypothetical protein